MISSQELRARARGNLGGSIFHTDWLTALAVCLVGSAIISIVPFASIFLFGPVTFGMTLIFLRKARGFGPIDFNNLFKGFSIFGDTLVLGLMQALIPALWCLIPIVGIFIGIRKSYSYAMAFFIKVDDPNAQWRECLDRSALMMEGHRFELFKLQLSFLGWLIVGALALGIGTLWVTPYMSAATANFYEELRRQA